MREAIHYGMNLGDSSRQHRYLGKIEHLARMDAAELCCQHAFGDADRERAQMP